MSKVKKKGHREIAYANAASKSANYNSESKAWDVQDSESQTSHPVSFERPSCIEKPQTVYF